VGTALPNFDMPKLTLSTKVGRLLLDCEPEEVTPEAFVDVPQKRIVFDYTYDGIMKSFAQSTKRFSTNQIDIVMHMTLMLVRMARKVRKNTFTNSFLVVDFAH